MLDQILFVVLAISALVGPLSIAWGLWRVSVSISEIQITPPPPPATPKPTEKELAALKKIYEHRRAERINDGLPPRQGFHINSNRT